MTQHGTASQIQVDGTYIEFQMAVLRALPRDIDTKITDEWRENGQALAKVLREALLPSAQKTVATEPLFDLVGTVEVPATTALFVAKNHFVKSTAEDAPVRVYSLGDNFRKWFSGKTEEPMPGGVLRCQELRRYATDIDIIAELGGQEKAATSLTELYFLLGKQGNGGKGLLRTDGYANILEIPDANGVLRSVGARFNAGNGWNVNANPVENPNRWNDGNQVFSRNYCISFLKALYPTAEHLTDLI